MIIYAWQAAGYENGEVSFRNVIDVAFQCEMLECQWKDTDDSECANLATVMCSHCSLSYCLDHFIGIPHLHN